MNLDKRQYQLLQRVVKTRQKTVPATPGWRALHTAFHLGVIVGDRLTFSVSDLEKIRELTLYKLSIDPFYVMAEGDRITLSGVTKDEKLSRSKVFSSNIHVARFGSLPITTPGGITFTPPNTALTIMDGRLDLSCCKSVVLIENGAMFVNWSSLELPKECIEALLIYRGHGSGIKTTYNLLTARPSTCDLFGFFDFDPAGIAMALQAGCDGVILPSNIDELIEHENIRRLNKTDSFHKQWSKNLEYLKKNTPPHLISIIEAMRKFELALTQETLINQKIKLKVYRIPLLSEKI